MSTYLIFKTQIKGFRVTRQGGSRFIDSFEKRLDPKGDHITGLKVK